MITLSFAASVSSLSSFGWSVKRSTPRTLTSDTRRRFVPGLRYGGAS